MTNAKTKNQRLIEIFTVYQKTVGGRACTTSEVADWALAHGLVPVPSMRSSTESIAEWEQKFAKVEGGR